MYSLLERRALAGCIWKGLIFVACLASCAGYLRWR